MDYSYIVAPIVGAIIGYSTNWIAVKMMFRPRKAIKIGRFVLPFTPGIIPKNRENIARTISSAISKHLLTEEDLRNTLLSEDIENKILESIELALTDNPQRLGSALEEQIGKENLLGLSISVSKKVSNAIYKTITEKHIGNILIDEIEKVVNEKIGGSIFSIFGGQKIINSMKQNIQVKVDEYIENNGESIINEMVESEINNLLNKSVSEVIKPNKEFYDAILKLYEQIVINKLPTVLSKINIQKIIEDKINSMDITQLEDLILKVMKKELNAIVNLGAVIGFVLGMINLLF